MSTDSFKVKNSLNISPKAAAGTQAGDIRVAADDSNRLKFNDGSGEKTVLTSNGDLDLSKAVVTDNTGLLASSATTSTEIGYVSGVTSAIQTQINGKQATGNYVTSLTGDVIASGPGASAATIAASAVSNSKLAASAVDDSKISATAAIARSKIAAGTANHVVIDDGSGNLSSEAQLAKSRGGSGADNSSVTFPSSGVIVTEAGSETLTNKTINGSSNTLSNVARSSVAAGTAGHVVINDGSGNLSSESQLAKSRGGTGADNSSVTFPATGVIVTEGGTEILTNKTLTSPAVNTPNINGGTASNSSKILLPSASTSTLSGLTNTEGLLAYDTTQKKPVYNNGNLWASIGSGAGGLISQREYITNGALETDIIGYAAYADAAGAVPVDGTGGSPNSTIAWTNSGVVITGVGNILWSKLGSANRQGEGFSYDFTIGTEGFAKKLQIEFDYIVASGTFTAGSDSTDSDIEIWIYCKDTGALIPVTPYKFYSNSTTIPNHFSAEFQTDTTSTNYRLIFHTATTTTNNYTMHFDNISVHLQSQSSSSSVVSWNGSQSSQAVTANVTDIAFTTIKDSSAAWNGTQYVVQVAGDYLVSGSLLPNSSSTPQVYRNGSIYNGSFFSTGSATAASAGATLITGCKPGDTISLRMLNSTTVTGGLLGIFLIGSQPGAGAGGVVALSANDNSAGAISNSAFAVYKYQTVNYDTAATYSTSTGLFTAQTTGKYHVSAGLTIASQVLGTTSALDIQIVKNGATIRARGRTNGNGGSNIWQAQVHDDIDLNAGDTVQIQAICTNATNVVSGIPEFNFLSIFLIPGTLAAASSGASVALSVNTLSSTTVTSGTALKWTTTILDSVAGYSAATGGYTCQTSGNYQIEFGGSFGSGGSAAVDLRKNGSIVLTNFGAINNTIISGHSVIWPGNAGDIFTVVPSGSCTAGSTTGFLSISLVK